MFTVPGLTNGILKYLWSWRAAETDEDPISGDTNCCLLASIMTEDGARMPLLSNVVFFFLFFAFHAWYTFRRRWNSSRQASNRSMSQDVLMVSRNSAYFHFDKSYLFETDFRDSRCWFTKADRTNWGIWMSSTVELFSIANRNASSWSRRSYINIYSLFII